MRSKASLRLVWLLILPVWLLGPALLPGQRFLPLLPIEFEPMATESVELAAAAREGANRVASDRLFPLLTDELAVREQLRAGTLPTWNPRLGLGLPLAAGSMAAPWNPLRWPWLLADPALAGGWHAFLAVFLAGFGMLFFLEGRGLAGGAAVVGALALQGSGFLVANLHYLPKVDAMIWTPWCLWAVDAHFRGRRAAGAGLSVALGLAALAGFPQVFAFVLLLTLAWILARSLEARRAGKVLKRGERPAVSILVHALLGVALGAVHLVPMWEVSAASTRVPQEAASIEAQTLPLAAAATMALPGVFGTPDLSLPALRDPAVWWWVARGDAERALNANRLEWFEFAGVAVLALALTAVATRPRRSLFPALALAATWFLLYGGPGASLLYSLPGLDIGSPARIACLAAVLLPWLAALGLDAVLGDRRAPRIVAAVVSSALVGCAFVLWFRVRPETWAMELDELLLARHGIDEDTLRTFFSRADAVASGERIVAASRSACLFGLASLATLLFVGTGRRLMPLTLVVIIEAALAGTPHTTPRELGDAALFPDSTALEAVADAAGNGRVLRYDRSETGISEVLRLARPNLLSAHGISDLTPYVAFPPRRQVELFDALDPASRYRTGTSRLSELEFLDHPLLDRMRVTCVLSTVPIEHERLEERYSHANFFVYHRRDALPEARVVPRLVAADGDAPERLADRGFDPHALALTEGAPPAPTDEVPFRTGELLISRPAADRVDCRVTESSGGWLVVHDGWAKGWKATVNGRDSEVLCLDHAFLGVRVPVGTSTVRLKYEPWSLRVGASLTLLALLIVAILAWLRRPARDPAPLGLVHRDASTNPR